MTYDFTEDALDKIQEAGEQGLRYFFIGSNEGTDLYFRCHHVSEDQFKKLKEKLMEYLDEIETTFEDEKQ